MVSARSNFWTNLQGPLLDLSERLIGYVKPGGRLGLSGILAVQAEGIIEHYMAGGKLKDAQIIEEEGWVCVHFHVSE